MKAYHHGRYSIRATYLWSSWWNKAFKIEFRGGNHAPFVNNSFLVTTPIVCWVGTIIASWDKSLRSENFCLAQELRYTVKIGWPLGGGSCPFAPMVATALEFQESKQRVLPVYLHVVATAKGHSFYWDQTLIYPLYYVYSVYGRHWRGLSAPTPSRYSKGNLWTDD